MSNDGRGMPARPAGDYGTDAPWVPWVWLGFGTLYLLISLITLLGGAVAGTWLTFLVLGIVFLAGGLLYVNATRRGKFEVWAGLLDGLEGPDEPAPRTVLDIGCGRGAVAIAAALRFPQARVTGVDLWRSADQSGNDPSATEANARANHVADRLTLVTGDMTELDLPDGAFDLVTASLSIHNVKSRDGRAAAVREAWRWLAPGGRLVIVDLPRIKEYAVTLGELSGSPVRTRDVGWRMWWSGPWMRSRVLSVTKSPGCNLY